MENNIQVFSQEKTQPLLLWGICIILFLPVIVLPPTFQPSDWGRAILFRTILTILVSFSLYKFFYKKEGSISIPKKEKLAYLPFFILLAFFVVLILSTIFSEDIRFSIFGSPYRAGGVLNLSFFFIFAIFVAIFIKEKGWKKLWQITFIVGFLASLLAFIQYFGFFENIFVRREGGGVPSFLGNSTFLAIFMLFLAFWSFTFFLQEKNRKKKIIYAGLSLLFFLTILITGSRATYLGVLIGFLFFFFFYPKKFKTLKIAAFSILLLVVSAVVLLNLFPQIAEKNTLTKIIADRLSIKRVVTDLAGTRFSAWKISMEAIKEKPILGWGPENFYIGFERYYDPTLSNLQKLWWDRAHNVFFDIASTSGIISVILYFLFWVLILWRLQRLKRLSGDNESTYLAHGIQTMFIGYLVVLFFNFDSFSTHLISFFFIGYAFYLLSGQEKEIILPQQKFAPSKKFIAIFYLLILSLFLWFWNIKPLYLDAKISYAQNLTERKKCEKAFLTMDKIWENGGILKSYAGLKYADFVKKCAPLNPEEEIAYAAMSLEALKGSSVIQPKFTRTWIFMGGFANVLAAREENPENKNKLLTEAREYLEKARKLSPGRQEVIIEMEKNYLLAENYQAMTKIAEDCIKIDGSRGDCYWYLGIAEIFLGSQESGKKHIQESIEKGGFPPPYIQLGAAYISQKNYKDAADAYHMLTAIYPENANYHAVMAFLSGEIGDYQRALSEVLHVFRLQPENKEAIEFLKSLLRLNADNPLFHSAMASIYKQLGEEEKAKEELLITRDLLLELISEAPEEPGNHFDLAGVYKELGEYKKARDEAFITAVLQPREIKTVENFLETLPLPEKERRLDLHHPELYK